MNYKKNVFLLTFLLLLGFMIKAQDIDLIRGQAKTAFLIHLLDDYEQNTGDAALARGELIDDCNELLKDQEDMASEPPGHFDADYVGDNHPIDQLSDLVLLCQAYALMDEYRYFIYFV